MSTVSRLQYLSELLTDSQRGYAQAAERVEDIELKNRLMKLGNGRAPIIEEVANELAVRGQGISEAGTFKGIAHRTWLDIRDSLSAHDDMSVLAECITGEEFLLDQYERAMKDEGVSDQLAGMLRGHSAMVSDSLNELRSWG